MPIRSAKHKGTPPLPRESSRQRTIVVRDGDWSQVIHLHLTDTEAHHLATELLGHGPNGVGKNFHIWGKGEPSGWERAWQQVFRGLYDEIDRREEAEYRSDRDDELLPGLRRALQLVRTRFQ